MKLFILIIGAGLLSTACNLEATVLMRIGYGRLAAPEITTLFEAMEHVIATEGGPHSDKSSQHGDKNGKATYETLKSAYTEDELYDKWYYLNSSPFRELRAKVVPRAMKYFADNFRDRADVEPVEAVKKACNTLAELLKPNKTQTIPKSKSRFQEKHVYTDEDLLIVMNLNSFCSIIEQYNWGKQ